MNIRSLRLLLMGVVALVEVDTVSDRTEKSATVTVSGDIVYEDVAGTAAEPYRKRQSMW